MPNPINVIKSEPLAISGAFVTLVLAGLTAASSSPTPLGWVAAVLPLLLGFVGRFVVVPWSKIRPLADAAAVAAAQVYPSKSAWAELIAAAVDDAAARASESGWPIAVGSAATSVSPPVETAVATDTPAEPSGSVAPDVAPGG